MKKYRVEFASGRNFDCPETDWQTLDEWMQIKAESAEEAALEAVNADGFENELFRVYELTENDFGKLEPIDQHNPEYFTWQE